MSFFLSKLPRSLSARQTGKQTSVSWWVPPTLLLCTEEFCQRDLVAGVDISILKLCTMIILSLGKNGLNFRVKLWAPGKLAEACATHDYQVLLTFADGRGHDDAGGLSGADCRASVDAETVLTVESQVGELMTECWRRQIQRHFSRLYADTAADSIIV